MPAKSTVTTAAPRPGPSGADQSPRRVREMFGQITPSYDRLNMLLSGSLDRRWRKTLARELIGGLKPRRRVLDLATGTGDLANAVRREGGDIKITGADFTRPMLTRAREKFSGPSFNWIEADGLALPFAAGAFDAVCIAFGLRNMADKPRALREMSRVARPGGRVAVMEFSQPPGQIMRRLYNLYSYTIMPRLGRLLSGSDAYLYLPNSIREFWSADELAEQMRLAGLTRLRTRSLMRGIVMIHIGEVGREGAGTESETETDH